MKGKIRNDYNDAIGQNALHFQAVLCFQLNVLLAYETELINDTIPL